MRTFTRLSIVSLLSVVVSACGGGSGSGGDLGGGDLDGNVGGDDSSIGGSETSGGGDALDDTSFTLPDSPGGCVPKTCTELGTNCGPVADGCGALLDCGTCTAPDICGGGGKASTCGTAPCTKKTCADLGASCGKQGDGCGALIDCGTCTAPESCGGGGVPNACGKSAPPDAGSCTPKTCAAMGYDCGPTADGCGALVDCGKCTTGTCGGGGLPNVCGSSTSPCLKKTCADWSANCGPVSDGCGGLTASCGTCSGGNTCGGGGSPSVCGGAPTACVPKTCADLPGTCGVQSDGCGGLTANCGSCTPPQSCGGGGVASVCGGGAPPCTKKTCTDYPVGTCGQVADGCGGLTSNCGTCSGGNTCGGGGTPSVCGGAPTCTKKTCSSYPAGTCGQVSDGCGGLTTNCGGCTAPAICGGGGVPSTCGGGSTSTTCVNLACKQVVCTGTATTSISGVVYDPAGLHPLPNVFVYVPNAAVAALSTGASCDKCSAALSGAPLVTATTDVNGKFKLANMPVDTNVPVVIQIGKWRRQITVTTSKCADTVVPASKTHLPRNKGEGNIPKIALTTGSADPLECLLRKIGIDDTEFTNPDGAGRINLFTGYTPPAIYVPPTHSYSGGAAFPQATSLWNSLDPTTTPKVYGLRAYDVVMMGCEGQDTTSNKPASALSAMQAYVNAGGRVFGEHYHYTWMENGPAPWPGMVNWNGTYEPFTNPTQETVLTTIIPGGAAFPKGSLMNQWMQVVGAATVATPSLFPVNDGRHSILKVNDTTDILQWIQAPKARISGTKTSYTNVTQYISFNTPVAAAPDAVCGRFVFSDIHVSSGDSVGVPFPSGCTTTTMTPQELALEFMFFDLASRVCDETIPPPPPTCTPISCASQGIACGSAPDGCGGTQTCGTCAPPLVCSTGGKCAGSSCTPTTCTALGYTCGSWPDGCGGALDCGPCTAPATCGGTGIPGKCGGSSCTPTNCATLGHDCGSWSDGCGGTLNCGPCTAPATCGGSGTPGKCGGTSCTPKTCAALGVECGSWADGCGGSVTCAPCPPPATCGGGGVPGKCGGTGCTPKTCAALGVSCGPSGDGCGGTIDCGPCATPDGGTSCVPLTCGGRCGPQGDGCGGILACPACDGGTCAPTTCAAAGAECGNYPDGCGGLLNCGPCVAPATCGGGGTPNKCGGIK